MTLNPLDPESRFYWSLAALGLSSIFVVLGLIVTFNAVSFKWRAQPVEVVVIDLKEREGQNSTMLAPVFEVMTSDGPVQDVSSAAKLKPLHAVGDRLPGYFAPETPRIETDATLRTARVLGYRLGGFGLCLGLFSIFLLRLPPS
ncbi:MAG: hypothetical protein MK180_13470 [Rhodobacteraceae bacterium]|nr:hypothetical protein [Paracoccaceae bacterium]